MDTCIVLLYLYLVPGLTPAILKKNPYWDGEKANLISVIIQLEFRIMFCSLSLLNPDLLKIQLYVSSRPTLLCAADHHSNLEYIKDSEYIVGVFVRAFITACNLNTSIYQSVV